MQGVTKGSQRQRGGRGRGEGGGGRGGSGRGGGRRRRGLVWAKVVDDWLHSNRGEKAEEILGTEGEGGFQVERVEVCELGLHDPLVENDLDIRCVLEVPSGQGRHTARDDLQFLCHFLRGGEGEAPRCSQLLSQLVEVDLGVLHRADEEKLFLLVPHKQVLAEDAGDLRAPLAAAVFHVEELGGRVVGEGDAKRLEMPKQEALGPLRAL